MIPSEWLDQARDRLAGKVQQTPLVYDPDLGVFLKWENRQTTGSFKLRGALNKVLTLQPWERERGLVTASAGNHGQGVAWAARETGVHVTVFASDHAVPAKLNAMRQLGADVVLVDGGYAQAESQGQSFARQSGGTWISPYNDGQVIAGQSTLANELLTQEGARRARVWIVPVGGGGLLAGVGAVLKREKNRPSLIGAQSDASPYFHALFYEGSQEHVVETDSLADGLAGAVEDGSLTIPMVRNLADEIALVSEEDISYAIAYAWFHYGETIEGSAAAALAAVLTGKVAIRPALVILSGGNIQPAMHSAILKRWSSAFHQEQVQ